MRPAASSERRFSAGLGLRCRAHVRMRGVPSSMRTQHVLVLNMLLARWVDRAFPFLKEAWHATLGCGVRRPASPSRKHMGHSSWTSPRPGGRVERIMFVKRLCCSFVAFGSFVGSMANTLFLWAVRGRCHSFGMERRAANYTRNDGFRECADSVRLKSNHHTREPVRGRKRVARRTFSRLVIG